MSRVGWLARLRSAAEVVILLPPGYNLGHVQLGKGSLWGIPELNLERRNAHGVTYRRVMSNFFGEAERATRLGVEYDALWDLPDLRVEGYREVIRIREDGKVEVMAEGGKRVFDGARSVERPSGMAPGLMVEARAEGRTIRATARVEQKSAPVFYTIGADTDGVYHNAYVAWELCSPGEEDYRYVQPEKLKPRVRETATGAEVEMVTRVDSAGRYRLRAATVDVAGRTTAVWREIDVD
jgi:hypothetical protein